MKRRLNWKPDKKDHRDKMYLRSLNPMPVSIDLRSKMSPIEDQGDLGSCTAHALAGALEYLEVNTPGSSQAEQTFQRISRLFIYYFERFIEGTVDQDSGAEIRDGIKALYTFGTCEEALWPYLTNDFKDRPNKAAIENANLHKIAQYQRLTGLSDVKNALASGLPVAFGIYVYDSFMDDLSAKTGIIPLPGPDEQCQGGHAVCIVGYDDTQEHVIVRNSWGESWGVKGYCYMPYDYITNPNLSSDFWVISK